MGGTQVRKKVAAPPFSMVFFCRQITPQRLYASQDYTAGPTGELLDVRAALHKSHPLLYPQYIVFTLLKRRDRVGRAGNLTWPSMPPGVAGPRTGPETPSHQRPPEAAKLVGVPGREQTTSQQRGGVCDLVILQQTPSRHGSTVSSERAPWNSNSIANANNANVWTRLLPGAADALSGRLDQLAKLPTRGYHYRLCSGFSIIGYGAVTIWEGDQTMRLRSQTRWAGGNLTNDYRSVSSRFTVRNLIAASWAMGIDRRTTRLTRGWI